jgi:hypothetical protein
MDGRGWKVLKTAAAVGFLLLLVDRAFPELPLSVLSHRSATPPDPLGEPEQRTERDREPWTEKRRGYEFTLTPRASYDVSARVANTERYWQGPAGALVPWDFVLTWGEVTREPYLSKVSYVQTGRSYNWSTTDGELDLGYIVSHSANTHLIPGSSRIASVLRRIRRGDVIRLEGDLVDVAGPGGFTWKTSLVRTDSGEGGCELMVVRAVTVGNRRYE